MNEYDNQNNRFKFLIITVSILSFLVAVLIMVFLIMYISREDPVTYNNEMLEVETVDGSTALVPETATAPKIVFTEISAETEAAPEDNDAEIRQTEAPTEKPDKKTTTVKTTKKTTPKTTKKTTVTTKFESYLLDVKGYIPIYKKPGYDNIIVEYITELTKYTIVEERRLSEDEHDVWGKLKSGLGWINIYDAKHPYEGGLADDGLEDGYDSYNAYSNGYPHFLADLNGDGTDELFVKTGTCEADYMWNVYTLVNNRASFVGSFSGGHSTICECKTGEFYLLFYHMDVASLEQIHMKDGYIELETIFPKGDNNDGSYGLEIEAFLDEKGIEEYDIINE